MQDAELKWPYQKTVLLGELHASVMTALLELVARWLWSDHMVKPERFYPRYSHLLPNFAKYSSDFAVLRQSSKPFFVVPSASHMMFLSPNIRHLIQLFFCHGGKMQSGSLVLTEIGWQVPTTTYHSTRSFGYCLEVCNSRKSGGCCHLGIIMHLLQVLQG